MEDRVRVLATLATGRRERGQSKLAELYETHAAELRTHAQQIRQILLESL
jgi:hypothetical protein